MTRRRWSCVALALCVTVDLGATSHLVSAQTAAPSPADPAKPVEAPAPVPAAPAPSEAKPAEKPVVIAPAKPAPAASTDAVVLDATSLEAVSGRSVKSPTGEDMGRIVDMLVTSSGEVRAAVIDFGGFLGVGSRKIAVDWKALIFTDVPKSGNVLVALTRNQVRMAPEYKQGDPIVVLEATTPEQAKAAASPKPDASKPESPKGAGQADGAKPESTAPVADAPKPAPSSTPTTDDTPKK